MYAQTSAARRSYVYPVSFTAFCCAVAYGGGCGHDLCPPMIGTSFNNTVMPGYVCDCQSSSVHPECDCRGFPRASDPCNCNSAPVDQVHPQCPCAGAAPLPPVAPGMCTANVYGLHPGNCNTQTVNGELLATVARPVLKGT